MLIQHKWLIKVDLKGGCIMTKEKFIERVRYYLSDEYLDEKTKWAEGQGLQRPAEFAYSVACGMIKDFLEEVE